MIWVAWRQFRTQALVMLGMLAAFTVLVLVTGLHLRDVYASLGAHCHARNDCSALGAHEKSLADLLGPALLAIPALLGMFWGAPLVARELESGTHRLAWTQSVTRRRWLLVKVALVGVAALAFAGVASLLVSWWFAPLDAVNLNHFDPSVFAERGVVAIGYAGFAFALGVAAGTLLRRTLPAIGATLLGFVAMRIAVTVWVRPHLLSATKTLVPVTFGDGVGFVSSASGVSIAPNLSGPALPIPNAWVISAALVDRARHAVSLAHLHGLLVRVCPAIAAGLPQPTGSNPKGPEGPPTGAVLDCEQRLSHHVKQLVTYQPPSHYWPLQVLETGIFIVAALALIGITVWRVGPRAGGNRAASGSPGALLSPSPRRSRQRSASRRSASPEATTSKRAATLSARVRRGCTEARWRTRLLSVAWMSAAILTAATGLSAGSGSGSSRLVRATPATTSTTASSARTRAALTAASPSTCVNADAQAPASGGGTPGAALPSTEPFYKWGSSLTRDAPGMILRARKIAFGEENTQLKTTQLLYVTTDELGCRTISVVTVFQPHKKSSASSTRIFSYQTSYDALGSQCDPSYTLKAGTEGETGFITSLADAGDTVLMADYEGEDAAYGVGQLSGYQTLDAIRAAETWLRVPEASTPVGMLGYSGGAVATEFASELAPTYAPHLDIVGVAEGGIPVDLFHELTYINHPNSPWTGQIPSYLDGLARGFDVRDLYSFYTREGIKVANADQTQCSGTFTGLTTKQMLKLRYQDIENIPVIVRIFDQSIMSRSGTPRAPLFITNGLSDPTGDGVTVTKDVQQLAYIYCRRGVAVEFHVYKGLNHSEAGTPFFAQGQTFLAQRFKGLPFHDRCASIGPGNSTAPIQVPAS